MHEATRLLSAIEQDHPQAAEQVLPLVHEELRRLAAQKQAHEKPEQILQDRGRALPEAPLNVSWWPPGSVIHSF